MSSVCFPGRSRKPGADLARTSERPHTPQTDDGRIVATYLRRSDRSAVLRQNGRVGDNDAYVIPDVVRSRKDSQRRASETAHSWPATASDHAALGAPM
jgi:hypothetical protein